MEWNQMLPELDVFNLEDPNGYLLRFSQDLEEKEV